MSEQKLVPFFKDGLAQPNFPFTDGKTGSAYDAETSEIGSSGTACMWRRILTSTGMESATW